MYKWSMVIPLCLSSRPLALALILGGASLPLSAMPLTQPVAPTHPATDTYFGPPVVDPYRWMEYFTSP